MIGSLFKLRGDYIATNKDGGRVGAIKDRFQVFNPITGLWVKFNAVTGKIMGSQKTKYRNVRVK